jgi:ABC-type uncharacterized transport system ATPase subunit
MIEIIALNKVYGEFSAVKNLNLTIKSAEMFGFLGPNGVGKTSDYLRFDANYILAQKDYRRS